MNSGTVLAGTEGLTTMTSGTRMMPATGAMSRTNEVVVERRVDCVRRGHQEKCVAVRWGTHDRFGADIGAATWAVFYDELLAEPPREPRSDEPRENVGQSAGGRGGDDAHRPRRIVLRPSETRHRR